MRFITLRITTDRNNTTTTLKFEGKIAGAWVGECLQAWHSVVPDLGSKKLCVDLRGVTFVDSDGRRLLAEIYRKHEAQFLANSPLTRYFAESAMDDCEDSVSTRARTDGRMN